MFQVFIVIKPVIALLAPGGKNMMTLFPNAERMCFNPSEILDITNRKKVHIDL